MVIKATSFVRMALSPNVGLKQCSRITPAALLYAVRMALSPNVGLKPHSERRPVHSREGQNGAKPECGIETLACASSHGWVQGQNGAKPECGIETSCLDFLVHR